MTTKHYVDNEGRYLGAFVSTTRGEVTFEPDVPQGAIEVPTAPDDARQLWDFNAEDWDGAPAEALIDYAVEKRRALANASTIVDVGNGRLVPVWTDPESRSSILGLVVAAGIDPQTTTNWKGADGTFYALNAGEITALGFGVRSWVQACFDAEAAVLAAIGNETITTFGQIDAANWPSND